MATLIKISYGGRRVRRCDHRCYMDSGKRCQCICGGVNHGVGLRQALKNTAEIASHHIHDSEASLFHSFTPKLLDMAMQNEDIIKPLVLLTRDQLFEKGGNSLEDHR